MSRIKELPKESSQLLSSTQIISSVQSVVKELVENSLDSLATNIEIKLDDFGLEKIEVKDNGKGICKEDIAFVAKPHCTSKITSHLHLSKVETYGFRGEALAALCSVAQLTLTTKTSDENFGFTYTFDQNGNVLSTKPCPCNQGTSFVASSLFKNIPVRRQFYKTDKNKKEELKKVEDVLISFGCIHAGVRFTLFHNRNLIWQKPSVHKTKESLVHIFGNEVVDHMENCEFTDDDTQINIEVFLPSLKAPLICSQSSLNRSIVAINKRPVRMKIIDKLLKEYYNKALEGVNKTRYPICYIAIQMPSTSIDVNFEPNKTAVAMENKNIIVEQLSKILSTFYGLDCNTENEVPKTVSTDSSELTPPASIEPMQNTDISNTSMNSSFQSKLSYLAPDFKKPSSTLSRNKDFVPPPNKKKRTSSSFATPPNDIHRHINTLKSFFSTTESEKNSPTINLDSLERDSLESPRKATELSVHKANLNVKSKSVSKDNFNIQSSEVLVLDNQFNGVTVQRNGLCETPVRKESFSIVNSPQVQISTEISVINKQFDGMSAPRVVSNHQFSSVQNSEDNKTSLIGQNGDLNEPLKSSSNDKDNLQNQVTDSHFKVPSVPTLIVDSHETSVKSLEVMNNSSKSSTSIDICEWSRGLHPVEKTIQPVTVLRQKKQAPDETEKDVEIFENKMECSEVSPNQRKMTPFDLFCRKHRLEVASLNPDFNNYEIAQILTERWSSLPMEEKAIYKNIISKEDNVENVKNKENLEKSATESLRKTKERLSTRKTVRKMKKKIKECSYAFNMELLKNAVTQKSQSMDEIEKTLNVLSCLSPGVWVCSQEHKLYLLNCFRLQETIVFQRLLETYQFEPDPLDKPFILTVHSLGEDGINVLSQMNSETDYKKECIITDEKLSANGFKIRILKSENENHFEVIGMTSNIAFYGVSDLQEILSIIKEKGHSVTLKNCRPGKLILYLQGEAVRIARQYPASKNVEDVEDILSNKNQLSSNVCIHFKPILHEIYTLPIQE
ncbi:hypothetical protein JTE90_007811 [Oedothorax gibbosus]|uniref:HMG box domain-containing protein n=1 Tax=Oedothorax gibbosus TaxID=931172 RepID=A0AAV6VIV5_9ARAC|nr:hypothetical protein JTE90_007811 [Oedothorax gibbosus]